MLRDHLGGACFAGTKFIPSYGEVKTLEAMTIYIGLESIAKIPHLNFLVETDCLEVINLLNNTVDDITEVSFFIEEAKAWSSALGLYILMVGVVIMV